MFFVESSERNKIIGENCSYIYPLRDNQCVPKELSTPIHGMLHSNKEPKLRPVRQLHLSRQYVSVDYKGRTGKCPHKLMCLSSWLIPSWWHCFVRLRILFSDEDIGPPTSCLAMSWSTGT